jgi:twitching motility protein PilT
MPRIDAFLQLGREQGCSDIHFMVGRPPLLRLDGELTPLKYRDLTGEETDNLLREILDDFHRKELSEMGSVDFSYETEALGRFRFNACYQRLGLTAVCRVIPDTVPNLGELGLPGVIAEFTELKSGLVLVTGGTGTGKSTTLAAMIHEINQNRNLHLLTLEDPIEFTHKSAKSMVVQREVGPQVVNFHDGLRSALRQDPDVILVGEMRDHETIAAAIEASETGHLVFGTLHTRGAFQTIHRVVDVFPSDSQDQIRHTLAENLRAVVSQELVKAADGRGRRAAVEVLVVTPAVSQLIRDGKAHQIPSVIATGRRVGMQLMDQSLLNLVQSGDIDGDEAFLKATDKRDFIPYVVETELLNLMDGPPSGGASLGS